MGVTTERGLQMLNLQLSQMLTLTPMRGTDTTDTVAMDGVATTGLTATTDTMERGPLRLNLQLSQLLPLTPMLMLMPGTVTTDTDTVATDGEATTGPTATTVTTERGLLRLNLKLMLMLGMDTTDTVVTTATDTDTVTTAPTDTGVTGAKPANREVDSSSDCDFPSTLASISRACA